MSGANAITVPGEPTRALGLLDPSPRVLPLAAGELPSVAGVKIACIGAGYVGGPTMAMIAKSASATPRASGWEGRGEFGVWLVHPLFRSRAGEERVDAAARERRSVRAPVLSARTAGQIRLC
jgi:hypothetical protein